MEIKFKPLKKDKIIRKNHLLFLSFMNLFMKRGVSHFVQNAIINMICERQSA